jgi:hypothetical protein
MKDWSKVPIPNSYHDLFTNYGNPFTDPHFEANYIVSRPHVIAHGKTVNIRSHIAIADKLHLVFAAIAAAGATDLITTYDGCYVVRSIRGSTHPSLHSWGLAIDINAALCPLGSPKRMPHAILQAFHDQGFFNGADFIHRKDPQHSQYATGNI